MRLEDKKFFMAAILTTFMAIVLYFFLSFISQSYEKNIAPSTLGEIVKAPFVVINLLQSYVWLFYAVAMLMLGLKWVINRVMV